MSTINNIKAIPGQSHQIALNHNVIDGKRLVSSAQEGEKWARVNSDVGGTCVKLLDVSFLCGMVSDYFGCFQDQDNVAVRFASNLWNAFSGAAFGYREERMYEDIYAKGIDAVNVEDINDQEKIKEKISFFDDYLENAHFTRDSVIRGSWKLTTRVAQVSAPLLFVSSFLGRKWNDLIFSLSQTPSRGTWRFTYLLAPIFHGNFLETITKATWLKLKSFVSDDAKTELNNLSDRLEKSAYEYAQGVHGNKSALGDKKGFEAYKWMLKDRLSQFKRGMSEPGKVLEDKIKMGNLDQTTAQERAANPEKNIQHGYVDPTSETDKKIQKTNSIVSYTALPCALVGLLGTFVFEPLRAVSSVLGLERGNRFLSFMANLRSPASLINYYFKFFLPEQEAGRKYKDYEQHVNNGTANEVLKQLHKAEKGRFLNSYVGFGIFGASFIDSFGQLFRSFSSDNKIQNFMFTTVSRLVGTGFMRYFSARRRDLGKLRQIHLALDQILGKTSLSNETLLSVDDKKFNEVMESLGSRADSEELEKPRKIYEKPLNLVADCFGSIIDKVSIA